MIGFVGTKNVFSPDGSGILLCNSMEQKIQRTAGIASNKA